MISKILKIVILSVLLAFVPSRAFAQYDAAYATSMRLFEAPNHGSTALEQLEWIVGERASDYDLSIHLENKIREQERARARQRAGTTIEEVNSTRNRRVANDNSKIGLRMSSGNSAALKARREQAKEAARIRREQIERVQTQEALQYAAKLNAMEAELTARVQNQIAFNTDLNNIKDVKQAAVAFNDIYKTGNVVEGKPVDDKNEITQGMQPVSDRPLPVLLDILEKTDSMSDFSDTEIVTINAFFDSIS